MKKSRIQFLFIFFLTLAITSCGDDDNDNSIPDTSASLTFDGTNYTKSEDDIVTFFEVEFDGVTIYSISATFVNGNDTLGLSISIPQLAEETYTKTDDDTDARISVSDVTDSSSSSYNTDGPLFSNEEDLTDYTIQITEVTDNTISGTFSATLYQFTSDSYAEASGEFVATDDFGLDIF